MKISRFWHRKKIKRKRWSRKRKNRLFAAVTAFTMIASGFSGVVAVATNDYSFYSLASSASTYYDASHKTTAPDMDFTDHDVQTGNAGAFLGYIDKNLSNVKTGVIRSDGAANAQTIALPQTITQADPSNLELGVTSYMLYGNAIQQLGLDSTEEHSMIEKVLSSIVYVFYMLAALMETLMQMILHVLNTLNPFSLFHAQDAEVAYIQDQKEEIGTLEDAGVVSPSQDSFMAAPARLISSIYNFFRNMAWEFTIPLMLVFLIFGMLVWNKTGEQNWSSIRKFAVRVVFLVAGIPMLGAMYTTALNQMIDISEMSGNSSAAYQIASVYVDTEGWINRNNMNLPQGGAMIFQRQDGNDPTTQLEGMSLQKLAAYTNGLSDSLDDQYYSDTTDYWDNTGDTIYSPENNQAGFTTSWDIMSKINSLLARYTKNEKFNSSSYESAFKSAHENETEELYDLIDTYSDPYEFSQEGTAQGGLFSKSGRPGAYLFNNGSLKAGWTEDGTGIAVTTSDPNGYGLSTLSMFNYLNTKFTANGITMISAANSATSRSSVQHNSVNVAGENGVVRLMNIIKCALVLVCYVLLGFFIYVKMLFHNIKASIKMMLNVPGAVLGDLKSIGRVIAYVIAMIVQILVSVLAYTLCADFLANFNLNALLNLAGGSGAATAAIGFGNVVPAANIFSGMTTASKAIGASLVSIIIYLVFIYGIYKIQKYVIEAVNDGIMRAVDKFIGYSSSNTNLALSQDYKSDQRSGPGVIQQAAGMAGNALMYRTIGGTGKSSKNGKNGQNGNTDGTDRNGNNNNSGNNTGTNNGGGNLSANNDKGSGKGGGNYTAGAANPKDKPPTPGSGGNGADAGKAGKDGKSAANTSKQSAANAAANGKKPSAATSPSASADNQTQNKNGSSKPEAGKDINKEGASPNVNAASIKNGTPQSRHQQYRGKPLQDQYQNQSQFDQSVQNAQNMNTRSQRKSKSASNTASGMSAQSQQPGIQPNRDTARQNANGGRSGSGSSAYGNQAGNSSVNAGRNGSRNAAGSQSAQSRSGLHYSGASDMQRRHSGTYSGANESGELTARSGREAIAVQNMSNQSSGRSTVSNSSGLHSAGETMHIPSARRSAGAVSGANSARTFGNGSAGGSMNGRSASMSTFRNHSVSAGNTSSGSHGSGASFAAPRSGGYSSGSGRTAAGGMNAGTAGNSASSAAPQLHSGAAGRSQSGSVSGTPNGASSAQTSSAGSHAQSGAQTMMRSGNQNGLNSMNGSRNTGRNAAANAGGQSESNAQDAPAKPLQMRYDAPNSDDENSDL